jgi:hypothetical protein
MTNDERMAEIKHYPNASSWRQDIAYLLSRVEELEAALGEAIERIDPYEESIFHARLAAARDGEKEIEQ